MKRTLPSIKTGIREKTRAKNGDGAIEKLVKHAFQKWHLNNVGTLYCEWIPSKHKQP